MQQSHMDIDNVEILSLLEAMFPEMYVCLSYLEGWRC